ncbi:septation protein IspZ [Halobacteriovorax marinus]|uniref:septation protein IspZ n=1 Tax=Halobacteriovorax marinus TaxID=97084 RepID=UPI003A93AA0C
MDKQFSKSFFLISFLPAIAYWYLDEYYPVRVAIAGGLALAILEIAAEKILFKHVHTISKANFFLILFLGGLSLLGEEGVWFRLQPALTGIGISSFMFYRIKVGRGLLEEFLEGLPLKSKPPLFFVTSMERHLTYYFFVTGLFMAYVAICESVDTWIFFKTIGNYILFGVFYIFEIFWSRKLAKDYARAKREKEVLASTKP